MCVCLFYKRLYNEMNDSRLTVLKELYDNTFGARDEIQNMIQENLNRMDEISVILNSVEESETIDYKVFSPRSANNIYKDKITKYKEEKEKLQNRNNDYYRKLETYDRQLSDIKELMKSISDDEESISKSLAILDIQEKERIRIARELHDSSLQNLTHIIHEIELSSKFIDQDPIRAKLELASCSQNLRQVINEIRDTIFNLRPMSFDDLGFKQCIENFIDECRKQFKDCIIEYEVDDVILNKEDISDSTLFLVTLYRVIQEALINSLKHSGANKLTLFIKNKDDKIFVNIIDNGKGFCIDNMTEGKDNKEKHFGLSIMRERIYFLRGAIEISSEPDVGTKIDIIVPKL